MVDESRRMTASDALGHQWFDVGEQSLADRNLQDNLMELQIFNAKQKFRAAIHTVRNMSETSFNGGCLERGDGGEGRRERVEQGDMGWKW